MKVDWWLRYDESGASSRYRALQYFDRLAADGWESKARSLAPYGVRRARQAAGAAARLLDVSTVGLRPRPDVAVVQKELVMPARLGGRTLVRRLARQPLVWDVDDAIWEVDPARRRQAQHLIDAADIVVVGSPALAEWCTAAGAKQVELLPTCAPVPEHPPERDQAEVEIAWIGSPSTAPYLGEIGAALLDAVEAGCRFTAMGGALPDGLQGHPRAVSEPWSPAGERALLERAAIGVAPAPRTPFADGKCGFKVVQYASRGMAVVATDNPTHRWLLSQSGTLASTADEWREALRSLGRDPARRLEEGRANFERARDAFSTEVGAARWSKVLSHVR